VAVRRRGQGWALVGGQRIEAAAGLRASQWPETSRLSLSPIPSARSPTPSTTGRLSAKLEDISSGASRVSRGESKHSRFELERRVRRRLRRRRPRPKKISILLRPSLGTAVGWPASGGTEPAKASLPRRSTSCEAWRSRPDEIGVYRPEPIAPPVEPGTALAMGIGRPPRKG
jgi:hypothetical protein